MKCIQHRRSGRSARFSPAVVLALSLAVGVATSQSAHAANALSCSGQDTHDLVVQIAGDALRERMDHTSIVFIGEPEHARRVDIDKVVHGVDFELSDVRTTARDATTGALQCAAGLHYLYPQMVARDITGRPPIDLAITYTVETTDDGRLYVTVAGLE